MTGAKSASQEEQEDEGGRDESHPVVPQPLPGQRPLTAALDAVLLGRVGRGLLQFAVVVRRRGLGLDHGGSAVPSASAARPAPFGAAAAASAAALAVSVAGPPAAPSGAEPMSSGRLAARAAASMGK